MRNLQIFRTYLSIIEISQAWCSILIFDKYTYKFPKYTYNTGRSYETNMSLRLRDIRMLKCKKKVLNILLLLGAIPCIKIAKNAKSFILFLQSNICTYFMNLDILRGQKYTDDNLWSQILLHHPCIMHIHILQRNGHC